MPFDLTTARPVVEKTGFDISTARPIENPAEVIYREETDSTLSAPPSLAGEEVEYLDNVQNRKMAPYEHVGFNHIGKTTVDMLEYPASLFKGAGAAVVNIGTDLSAGTTRQVGEARKEIFTDEKPYNEMTVEEKLDRIRRRNNPFLVTQVFGSIRDKELQTGWLRKMLTPKAQGLQEADDLIAASQKIEADGKKFLEKANFVREDGTKGFIFDIGGVGTTIASSVGLTLATKNPLAATAMFRDLQKNNIYLEAQEKGWENMEADKVSTLAGNFEGALEFVGMQYFLKAAEVSKPIARIALRALEESIQEAGQTAAEETITQLSALRPVDIEGAAKNIGYSMVLGAIGGGGVSTAVEIGDKLGKEQGIPKPITDKLAEKIIQNLPQIESELTKIVTDQTSPLRDDNESLSKVEKIYADFVAGKEIDISELSLEEQGVLQALDISREIKTLDDKTSLPTFKKWFADSKVVGEDGKPLVVYHGTSGDIETFDVGRGSRQTNGNRTGAWGTYFTPSQKEASIYAEVSNGSMNVVPVLLSLKNPYVMSRAEWGKHSQKSAKAATREEGRVYAESVRKDLETQGFDGIVIRDKGFNDEWVAFSPTQIKSIFNPGTFDGNDPRINDAGVKPLPVKTSNGGSGNNKPPSGSGPTDGPNPERDYAIVANQERKNTLLADTGAVFKDVHGIAGDLFSPVSSRLGRINQKLKHDVRKFVYKTGLYTHEDRVKIRPFVDKVSNTMSEPDYRIFDLALKNRDMNKINELVTKYDLSKDYENVRAVLDNLHALAQDVGMDLGFIENYFPRKVKQGKAAEYIAFMRKQDTWSDIKLAMRDADPNETMTEEEQAEFVNTYLRGYGNSKLDLSKPDSTKERTVDYVTAEFNEFYEDSMPTLLQYVGSMRHAIESRKLFGKSETETENNIGAYVLTLIDQGAIKPEQELELRKLLSAVVDPNGTRGAWAWAKNASYVYLMGNPISAITQIQDLAFSLHFNGYYRTTKSLLKSLTGNSVLTKEDIGLENILHEFEDNTRAGKAVRKTFDLVGLSWMDNIGKQTFMDAAYSRVRAANKKNSQKFNDMLDVIFGDEAEQVKQDLTDGTMSENVKYLMFSELSDVQPITLAEMPVGYLKGGNGRVFYMLKTYTIKQVDIYRREIFDEITSGDIPHTAKGMRNLISLATSLMLMGMSSDALKDLLLGREIDLSDLVMDNILKTMAFTKYQIYKAKEEGVANAFFMTLVVPPIGAPINDVTKDIAKIGFGDKEFKDSELLGRIPFAGKFYYWWWGGGRAKEEKDQGKKTVGGF